MPTYEYRCDTGHSFDVLQSMAEDSLTECQVCGAPARRILRAPAVHFKGSGFYTTDYARKGAGKESNGSAGDGSKDSKSETKSSDSSSKSSDSKGSGDSGSSSKSDSKAATSKD